MRNGQGLLPIPRYALDVVAQTGEKFSWGEEAPQVLDQGALAPTP